MAALLAKEKDLGYKFFRDTAMRLRMVTDVEGTSRGVSLTWLWNGKFGSCTTCFKS